jgi:hypothetical protein
MQPRILVHIPIQRGNSSRRSHLYTLRPLIFAIAALLAGGTAFASLSAGPPEEQTRGTVRVQVIDSFLADSRRYLGL